MKQQQLLLTNPVKFVLFILSPHHQPWENFVMNGQLLANKMFLEKFLKLWRCKVRAVLQVPFMEHCMEVRCPLHLPVHKGCF